MQRDRQKKAGAGKSLTKRDDEFKEGYFVEDLMHGMETKRIRYWIRRIFLMVFLTNLLSCSVDKDGQFENLKENLEDFENLRNLIESRYRHLITDTAYKYHYVIFVDCDEEEVLSENLYFCNDKVVLEAMKALDIREVSVKKSGHPCQPASAFNEMHFLVSKANYYPLITYLFDYCGEREFYESKTIFYKPVTKNWGVMVDSNFP